MNSPVFFQHFFLMATLVLSLWSFYHPTTMNRCTLHIGSLDRKQYDRLLLSGFVHVDYVHLAFNVISYYAFAYLWADIFVGQFGVSWWMFGFFYSSAIVIVNIVVWIAHRQRKAYRSLGASGGVSALVFSCILFFPWERLYVFFIPMPAILFGLLYMGYSIYRSIKVDASDRINHLAHFVGALYGILFTWIIEPDTPRIFLHRLLDL